MYLGVDHVIIILLISLCRAWLNVIGFGPPIYEKGAFLNFFWFSLLSLLSCSKSIGARPSLEPPLLQQPTRDSNNHWRCYNSSNNTSFNSNWQVSHSKQSRYLSQIFTVILKGQLVSCHLRWFLKCELITTTTAPKKQRSEKTFVSSGKTRQQKCNIAMISQP